MNCREHQEFFSDLYDGHLPADRRRDLEAHLASCADCRTEYDEFSASLHALREAPAKPSGDAFVHRVVNAAREETERLALYHNTGLRRPTTRRMTSNRRAVWAVPAIAASALVAFAAGFMVQKHASDLQIEELQGEIAKIDKVRPVQPQDPTTPVRSTQEIVDLFLKEKDIILADGIYMSGELRDRLNRGEMKVGDQWVDAKKEIARQVAEEMAKTPGDTDARGAEERVLARLDLVKRGDWHLPRRLSEALDGGKVIDANGEPRDMEEVLGDRIRELGLVRLGGQWMRPEERTELLAARRVEIGDANSAIARALDGLEIGPPLGFRNLLIYPLVATKDRKSAILTLPEAWAADRVEITEGTDALQVKVKNKGDTDLALFAGELLVGGRHDRVVARDTIVPAKKDKAVEVYDAEPAALRPSDRSAFAKASAAGAPWAPLAMRRLLSEEAGQGGIWTAILSGGGKTGPVELHRDHKAAIAEFRTALKDLRAPQPKMVGIAVAVGDTIAAVEVYGTPAIFAAQFDRILDSAVLEAVITNERETRFPADLAPSPLAVKRLAESALAGDPDAEGDALVVRRNGRNLGRALVSDGEAIRILLFPDGPPAGRSAIDRIAIDAAKLAHIVKAYEARLAKESPRRPAWLRELAMLPGELPRQAVMAKLQGPLRRDAIEALGLRGDPAAAPALLRVLAQSRNDLPTYGVAAQAVARIGGEESASALIEDLDPKNPALARVAAEHLPALVAGIKNVNVLETTMGNLIQALNRIDVPTDAQGTTWPHRTLMLVTGKSFVKPADYVNWWGIPINREQFLERFRR